MAKLPISVRETIEREIESHRAAITDLERFLLEASAPTAEDKKSSLTPEQDAKRRKRLKAYWKKKKAEKLAKEQAAHEEAEKQLGLTVSHPAVSHPPSAAAHKPAAAPKVAHKQMPEMSPTATVPLPGAAMGASTSVVKD